MAMYHESTIPVEFWYWLLLWVDGLFRFTFFELREVLNLATHKSAIKRAKQNEKRRLRNKSYRTRVKNVSKEVREAVASNRSPEEIQASLRKAVSIIQKTASKGVIHKRKAARKISRLYRLANQAMAASS